MRLLKKYEFNGGIKGFKLGWSVAGPPLMTVYCYLFGNVMIDTAQPHMAKEVVDIARENKIGQIFLTHHHEDHSGNAAVIQKKFGTKVFGHEQCIIKMKHGYPILPYQKYIWGKTTPLDILPFSEKIETSLGTMIPIHTPGHSRDHTVFFLPEKGIIFSGDLYLGDRIRFFRADEDIGFQIDSLKKVANLDFDTLLCAHNPREKNGKGHVRLKLEFLEELYERVIALWKQGLFEKEIFRKLRLKEDYFTKYFCFGNVSMLNGVRSVIRHHENRA
ncbi:conserved hypothetical protein [Desulfamplus magnetovallimortis]|uniref:Metallo-beta-lactamase domain-containing protein n=1 Tax=Desulfamplus magnetovallimortis TaxID=1246637 RepID=A0A1W1HJD3_9BACT|nr:conserved hypothetical protein [Desulfamplus magnetovallimortis]